MINNPNTIINSEIQSCDFLPEMNKISIQPSSAFNQMHRYISNMPSIHVVLSRESVRSHQRNAPTSLSIPVAEPRVKMEACSLLLRKLPTQLITGSRLSWPAHQRKNNQLQLHCWTTLRKTWPVPNHACNRGLTMDTVLPGPQHALGSRWHTVVRLNQWTSAAAGWCVWGGFLLGLPLHHVAEKLANSFSSK